MDREARIAWDAVIVTVEFGLGTIVLFWRARRLTGRLRWPICGRYLVAILAAGMTCLFGVAALARHHLIYSLNGWQIEAFYVVAIVMVTWVAVRTARGRLLLGDPPAETEG